MNAEPRACPDCARAATGTCQWHAAYNAGYHLDAARAAPSAGEGLDVERLAQAITMHSIAQRAGGPDAYFGHKCMGDCAADIAREYAALRDNEDGL